MVTTKEKEIESRNFAARLPFSDLSEPGTYLSNWSGHLIRVPDDGVVKGRSPVIEIVGREAMFVTKLSDNPYIAVSKARMIAADLDLPVNF